MTHYRIGPRLRALRRGKRLSQYALAEMLGVARSVVSEWETGRRPVPPERLENLTVLLHTTKEALCPAPLVRVIRKRRRARLRPAYPSGISIEQVQTLGAAFDALVRGANETLGDGPFSELVASFPRDTREELVFALNVAERNARLVQTAPFDWRCPVHVMHDLLETSGADLLQPAIEWRQGDERMLVFGQVWLAVPRHAAARVDFLVRYERKGHPPLWFFVEIDDGRHKENRHADEARDRAIGLPRLRYENHVACRTGIFPRFLRDVRELHAAAPQRARLQRRRARELEAARRARAEERRNVA